MKSKKNMVTLGAILILAVSMMVLAAREWGITSAEFWVTFLIGLGAAAVLISVYWKNRRSNELIKCRSCGRTMLYSVFHNSGGCPKCHTDSYVRTGVWPKG
jgi:hypothetical protein